ncbi:MAG: DUF3052 domain-containing protein [Lysobacterales bacterium]
MQTSQQAGYSNTPLARKLGIGSACKLLLIDPPEGYLAYLGPLPEAVELRDGADAEVDLVQIFVSDQDLLIRQLSELRARLGPEAVIWVSWPKKASKLPSTVSEDSIRAAALPLGYLDVKVCAVDAVWSGLKLVVRKALRAEWMRGAS